MAEFQDTLSLHEKSVVVDAHCDTLTAIMEQCRGLGEDSDKGQADLPRLIRGGVNVQFFAAFISPVYRSSPLARAMEIIDRFYMELEANKQSIVQVLKYNDISAAMESGKLAAVLSVEGGEALSGSIQVLRNLYRLGVRSLTLTWNGRNELGDGVGEGGTGSRLTSFGEAVVKEMNSLGMLVDVSHLSDPGFWHVLKVSQAPVMASHSNCRSLCQHPRNLTDEQIKALAAAGGVLGINFYADFVCSQAPSLDRVVDHMVHIGNLAGTGCIGLGSDFDGADKLPPGLEDVSLLPGLTDKMAKRGFSNQEIEAILGKNFLGLMQKVLA